eukprot:GGOE01032812.1.p1 GENE.GGOE01032812.1~~GGOE01032812.1.p1  ORF type:complete len:1149 (-),score=379.79 GGOE01032812.1:821-3820(-)
MTQIFSGAITVWDDRRITDLNPNLTSRGIPPNVPIEVVMTLPGDELTVIFEAILQRMFPNFTTTTPAATRMPGLMPMIAYVMQKPFTIGFCGLDVARAFELPTLRLRKGVKVVEPTVLSTTYAVLELGLSFGNNGEDPSHLTSDLSNAQGVDAWPLVGFAYVAVRKDTMRTGATCEHRRELVNFFRWFLTSDIVERTLQELSLAPLPSVVRDIVVARLTSDILCNGKSVWVPDSITEISGAGSPLVAQMFGWVGPVYNALYQDMSVTYDIAALDSDVDVRRLLWQHTFVATTTEVRTTLANTARLLFAGVGLVAVSQYLLVLDLATLTRILNGGIATWGHPDLLKLNPNGIRHMYTGQALGNQSIVLLRGPTFDTDLFRAVMASSPVPYTGQALRFALPFTNENVLRFSLAGIPFGLTVTAFTGGFTATTLASMRRADGQVVAPSWSAIQACASADAYDAASGSLRLSASAVPSCYPLAETVYLLVPRSQCDNATDPNRTRAVRFMEWLFGGAADGAVQEQSMAPLRNASSAIAQANAYALKLLSCDPPPAVTPHNDLPLGPILGGCIGGIVAVAAVVGWLLWRSSRELHAMRKQVSDITVAKDCAEAIACFDLESVDWLRTVPKPTPIQQAFVRIVSLLTEVRPFIPDQLLSSLQSGNSLSPAFELDALEKEPEPKSPTQTLHADSGSDTSDSHRSSNASHFISRATSEAPKSSLRKSVSSLIPVAPLHRKSRAQSRIAGCVTVRKATYLFVKFGVGEDWEMLDQSAAMGAASSHIIALGKAQGATVDKVMFDTVTFHWNVSSDTGTGPLKATLLTMEVAKVWDSVEEGIGGQPWVRVGVGYGPSVVTTVSAAKQRFFVIGGRQVAMAVDLVNTDCSAKCKAAVLLSNSVYKEVRYAVRCFPRLWFGAELLWEPVAARENGTADEWMYQLQSLESNDNDSWNGQAMAEVFFMVRENKPPQAVRQAVAEVRRRYGSALTPHDGASLDHLLAGLSGGVPY